MGKKFLVWFLISTFLVFGIFSIGSVLAAPGINKMISFQGKVVNSDGTNVSNGSYSFLFCIYTTDSPTTPCTPSANNDAIWRESKSITVTDGIFQTNLGDTTTLPGAVDFNTDNIYLGINFNSDGQMTPLVHFTAAPYAMNAAKVGGLTVTNTTGTLTIADSKTLTFNNTLTFSGTDSTSFIFPSTSGGTVLTSNAPSQGITSTQSSGTVLSLTDTTALSGAITGASITLSGSGAYDQTGLQFSLSGASGTNLNDIVGSSSTWKVSTTGASTFSQVTAPTYTSAAGLTINSGNNTVTIDASDTTITASGVTTLTLAANTSITNASGNITLQPAGSGTTATVQIGAGGSGSTTPDFFALDVKSTTGDPTGGFEGAMYYNTFDNKFRCYQDSGWTDCIGSSSGMTSFNLAGSSGTPQTITDGNTLTIAAGNGISTTAGATDTVTIALSALTADWNQTGAYDIVLNNAASELKILESTGDTYYGIFDVTDLSADRTYTFPNVSGTIATLDGGQTFTSATWNGTAIGAQYGGTGINTASSTGVPTISSGTWSVASQLGIALGGTNATTIGSAGSIAYSTGTAYAFSAAGTTGQALISGGTGAPTWFAPTAGSVLFAGTSGILQQDNANFFWDDTNNRLGLGTTSPNAMLEIFGTANALRLTYDAGNYGTISATSTGDLNFVSSNTSEAAFILGTGTAQDASVQFDGASVDYFAGLDHTTGSYMIGSGFTVQESSAYFIITSSGLVGINMAPTARLDITHSSTSVTAGTEYGLRSVFSDTGVVTTGTDTTFGFDLAVTRTGATGGTINAYGQRITLTTDNAGSGTSIAYGQYIDTGVAGSTNADTVYGLYITTEANTSTTAYGLYVDAGTQVGTEYAAAFLNGSVGIGDTSPDALLDLDFTQTSGILYGAAAPSSVTLSGALTGLSLNLSTNVTATGQSVTGSSITLPTVTNTGTGTYNYYGVSVTGNAITQNTGAGTDAFAGFIVTNPNITQTTGAVTATGLNVTTGSITTGGTQRGVNVTASGVSAGTLNGLNISSITGGAGTEDAIVVGTGWDKILSTSSINISGTGAISGATGISSSGTISFSSLSTNGFVKTTGGTGTLTVVTSIDLASEVGSSILPLANGGTNKNLTAVPGGIAWTDSDSFEISAAGTTGQALISGGTGAPTWFAPTAGSVLFAGTSGILQQDNANFFWDDTNNRLGIGGDTSPDSPLEIVSTDPQLRLSYTDGSVDGLIYIDSNEYLILQAGTSSEIKRVQIGAGGSGSTTPDFFALDVKSTTGDPTGGFEGAMYYNTFDNKFRCYQDSGWTDCIGSGGSTTLQGAYDNDADGSNVTISLTAADDGLVITNPTSGGTDGSAFVLQVSQQNTTAAVAVLDLVQSSNNANAVNITANSIDNETGLSITANGLTSGSALSITSSATSFTGSLAGVSLTGSNASNTGNVFAVSNTGTANANTSFFVDHRATGTNNLAVRVNDEASDATPFVIDGAGNVGIGTAAPSRVLDIFQSASAPQLRLSKDLTNYSEFTVDSVGDLLLAATGSDIRMLSENLWVCDNDACPALTLTGDGNIFIENVLKFGNGVYLKNDSASELGVYDNDDNLMLIFDEL